MSFVARIKLQTSKIHIKSAFASNCITGHRIMTRSKYHFNIDSNDCRVEVFCGCCEEPRGPPRDELLQHQQQERKTPQSPLLKRWSSTGVTWSWHWEQCGTALRILFDDMSFCNYRVFVKISLKYRYRIFLTISHDIYLISTHTESPWLYMSMH